MTWKIAFFERWSWFRFNNFGLALGTNLKFCTSVAKRLQLKVRKFWGPNPTFVAVTGGKTGREAFLPPLPPRPSWIGLRYRRSCEKKLGYCKVCSRVRENNFYEYNAFLNLILDSTTDDYLNISNSERIDLDVFLNKPAYFPYCHCEFRFWSFQFCSRFVHCLLLCSCKNVFNHRA